MEEQIGGMEIRRRRSTQEMTEEEKEGGEKGWLGAREVGSVQACRRECTDCPLCS